MKSGTINAESLTKVLIIGANGFLGSNIFNLINKEENPHNFLLTGLDLKNTNLGSRHSFYQGDITNQDDIEKKIKKISPDVVLLTAAMTDVDQCEVNKELATKINTEGPRNVLKACKKIDAKLVFISTDFVFDGSKTTGGYKEEDIPNPLCHYAKTKYDAEQLITRSEIDYLICRTAVLYGWDKIKLNFITWVIYKLQKGEKIKVVTTQKNSPTFVRNLAEILLKLIEKRAFGIYHTAGNDILSRYEMAVECAKTFDLYQNLIAPIDSFEQKAIRPLNAGLSIRKLQKFLGSEVKIFTLKDGLSWMKSIIPK